MTNLYPKVVLENDYNKEFPDIDDACHKIHKACKGWGTDEGGLIKVLGTKSPAERYYINRRYPELYDGQDLDDLIQKECGEGDFGFALRLLAMTSDDAEVKILRECTRKLGTEEQGVYQILCGRSNADIDLLKKTWYRTYETDLGTMLASELGGDFERLIFNCLQGIEEEYDEEVHTMEKAEEDAAQFYEAGQGAWGTDEKGLFRILCAAPAEHLAHINTAYVDKYGYALSKALEKELNGTTQEAALFHLNMKLKPYATIAAEIKLACAGFGTNEFQLTSHIIRYHQVIEAANDAHKKMYEKGIADRIKSELRGDYEKLLVTIVEHASKWEFDK